jgi:hypothetical protein
VRLGAVDLSPIAVNVADGHSNRVSSPYFGVRQKRLAARVDGIEHRLVEPVQVLIACLPSARVARLRFQFGRPETKTHRAERCRCQRLDIRVRIDSLH